MVHHGVELLLLVSMLFPLTNPKPLLILKVFLYTSLIIINNTGWNSKCIIAMPIYSYLSSIRMAPLCSYYVAANLRHAQVCAMESRDRGSYYIDILLLGMTGMGKSTTGNKLLGVKDDGTSNGGDITLNDLVVLTDEEGQPPEQRSRERSHSGSENRSTERALYRLRKARSAETIALSDNTVGNPPDTSIETTESQPDGCENVGSSSSTNPASTSESQSKESHPPKREPSSYQHPVASAEEPQADTSKPPITRSPQEFPHFRTGSDLESLSVTVVPKLISKNDSLRILDTPGFAHTDGSLNVIRANVHIMKQIARIQEHFFLNFGYVLYFLPCRGPPQRADRLLKDEMLVIHQYFGERIWSRLVFVLTSPVGSSELQQDETKASLLKEGGKLWEKAKRVISVAMQDTWNSYKGEEPKLMYIDQNDTSEIIMEKLENAITGEIIGWLRCLCENEMDNCETESVPARQDRRKLHLSKYMTTFKEKFTSFCKHSSSNSKQKPGDAAAC